MTKTMRWLALFVLLSGCDLPGKPNPANKFVAPTQGQGFRDAVRKNCAGCHGKDGKMGPAPPLNDAVFLAIVPEKELVKVIAGGRKGTEMPAFAKEQGGTLTAEQVQALPRGCARNGADAAVEKKDGPLTSSPPRKGTRIAARPSSLGLVPRVTARTDTGMQNTAPINDPAFLDPRQRTGAAAFRHHGAQRPGDAELCRARRRGADRARRSTIWSR